MTSCQITAVSPLTEVQPVSESSQARVAPQTSIVLMAGPSGYVLRFRANPGGRYAVQRSPDLNSWSTLEFQSPATDEVLEYVDSQPPPSRAFYRLLEQ